MHALWLLACSVARAHRILTEIFKKKAPGWAHQGKTLCRWVSGQRMRRTTMVWLSIW